MNNQVSLRIHSVKCVDETGGNFAEKFGNDEIKAGAVGITAGAHAVKTGPTVIGMNFDDGETVRFSPPKKLIDLRLTDANSFPKTCFAILLLAEIDNGGFSGKINTIFNRVKQEIGDRLPVAAGGGIGVGPLPGPQLGLIGEVVKPIVLNFIESQLRSGLSDDVFPARYLSVTVSSNGNLSTGGTVSPQFEVEFRGHGGVYRMTCDWALS